MNVIFFDGFIRNQEELCTESANGDSAGYAYIAKGYEEGGFSFLKKLNGLFAFVLYDSENERYVCVRDRFGGKRLYYTVSEDGRPYFSGSMKELFLEAPVKKRFNEKMLEVYLSYSYIPGEETMLQDIYKPLPGYVYVFEKGKMEKKRYYIPEYHIDADLSPDEYADRLAGILDEIFSCQTDCCASFLSGGVDSSYLVSRTKPKYTYTASYEENDFSEAEQAEKFSEQEGAEHGSILISAEQYLDAVGDTMDALEQPSGDASAEVLLLLCREIRKNHFSCFSGEGIDELFSGYYLAPVLDLPENDCLGNYGYIGCTQVFTDTEKEAVLRKYDVSRIMKFTEEAYRLSAGADGMNQAAMVDLLVWLDGNLLSNISGISADSGLTLLTPYLDNRLLDLTLKIPGKYKQNRETTKLVFRKAAAKVLDREIAERTKRGFPVPIRLWMRRPDYVRRIKEAFLSDTADMFFYREKLINTYDQFIQDEKDVWSWRPLWCVFCFIVWYDGMVKDEDISPMPRGNRTV